MAAAPASAALGLKVRTGRAVAVVLTGTRRAPAIALRREILLADGALPESKHPFHLELDDPSAAGQAATRRAAEAARRATRDALKALLVNLRARAGKPASAAIVASSFTDPARIAGAHARAHAEEGKLYRDAVAAALAAADVPVELFLEKTLDATAAERLGRAPAELAAALKAFAREVGAPWRAHEKQAALAAWLVLPKAAG